MPTYRTTSSGTYVPAHERTTVALTLLSETLTPEAIADRVSLRPDRSWRAGDRRSARSTATQRYNGWEISSGLAPPATAADHVSALLSRVAAHTTQIRMLISTDSALRSARLWIAHHTENWNPGLELSQEHLAALSDLGVSVALDVYTYGIGELGPVRIARVQVDQDNTQ